MKTFEAQTSAPYMEIKIYDENGVQLDSILLEVEETIASTEKENFKFTGKVLDNHKSLNELKND